jgi:hypothetical protein
MMGTVTSFSTSDGAPYWSVAPQPVTTPCIPVKLLPAINTHFLHYARHITPICLHLHYG